MQDKSFNYNRTEFQILIFIPFILSIHVSIDFAVLRVSVSLWQNLG